MHNKQQLEDDIQRMLVTINAFNSQDEEPGELPEPQTTQQEQDEPIETYHIYPMQDGFFVTKEETEQIIDSTPSPARPPLTALIFSILCSLMLVCYLIFISTIPTTKQLRFTRSISLPVQLLSPVTISLSETIVATGRGHQDATYAHGIITFYNGSFTQQVIPQHMIFSTANGIQIATDQAITIPPGNPPNYGQATISAHVINPGAAGNISAGAINTICCATSVKAVNTEAFIGGKNARDYTFVSKQDIDNGIPPLKQAVFIQAQAALKAQTLAGQVFISLPCTSTANTNHRSGEEANSVTITVLETCAGIAYSQTSLQEKARQLVYIPPGFMLVSFQVHTIDTTILPSQKGVTVTVAITAVIRYHEPFRPQVK
jgi:baseplate J-like protein